jgi:hypothetical protein
VGGCCCEREPEEEDKGDGITLELMGGGFVSKQDCLDPLSLSSFFILWWRGRARRFPCSVASPVRQDRNYCLARATRLHQKAREERAASAASGARHGMACIPSATAS